MKSLPWTWNEPAYGFSEDWALKNLCWYNHSLIFVQYRLPWTLGMCSDITGEVLLWNLKVLCLAFRLSRWSDTDMHVLEGHRGMFGSPYHICTLEWSDCHNFQVRWEICKITTTGIEQRLVLVLFPEEWILTCCRRNVGRNLPLKGLPCMHEPTLILCMLLLWHKWQGSLELLLTHHGPGGKPVLDRWNNWNPMQGLLFWGCPKAWWRIFWKPCQTTCLEWCELRWGHWGPR